MEGPLPEEWLAQDRSLFLDSCIVLYLTSIDAECRVLGALQPLLCVGMVAAQGELTRRTSHSKEPDAPLRLSVLVAAGLAVAEMTAEELLLYGRHMQRLRQLGQRMGSGEMEAFVLAQCRGGAVVTEDRRARAKMTLLNPAVPVYGLDDFLLLLIGREIITAAERERLLRTLGRQPGVTG